MADPTKEQINASIQSGIRILGMIADKNSYPDRVGLLRSLGKIPSDSTVPVLTDVKRRIRNELAKLSQGEQTVILEWIGKTKFDL